MLGKEELVMIKGKRTKRPRPDDGSPPPPLADHGDNVLSGISLTNSSSSSSCNNTVELRDASAAVGKDEEMANCLILLSKGDDHKPPAPAAATGVYQCKTCSKSFPSFQALGGHRASHTKPIKPPPQPPVASEKREHLSPNCGESTILSLRIPTGNSGIPAVAGKTARVHECTICGAEFASGQALGGHMRRHRPIPAVDGKRPRNDHLGLSLDLNLPAPEDHDVQRESRFPFAAKQVIVFSASPMVDCHY